MTMVELNEKALEREEGHYWTRRGTNPNWDVMYYRDGYFWGTTDEGYHPDNLEIGPRVFDPGSAIPAPDDGLVEKLRGFEQAYSTEFFAPLTQAEKDDMGGFLLSRASAEMGRHLAKFFTEAATALQSQAEQIERLKTLNADLLTQAKGHAQEARTANSTVYEIYQVLSGGKGEPGNWNGAEPARRFVEAAEQQVQKLRDENAKLREALEPFAKASSAILKSFPDKQRCDFALPLRVGDFRAARTALETQEGGE